MNISPELILSLSILYGAFFMLGFRTLSSFPAAIVSYVPVSSIASLIQLTIGIQSNAITIIIPSGFFLIAILEWKRRKFPNAIHLATGIIITGALAFSSQFLTRLFGLSSVGFTDGHTILVRGQDLASGTLDKISGTTALKRGFGLSAIQAQGLDGEYLVGFMPLVFLGAMIASSLLVNQVYRSRAVTIITTVSLVPLALGIEAISRHVYLMNSHSYAWLFMASLLAFIHKAVTKPLTVPEWAGIFTVFSAIGFMRFDYVVIFSVVGVALILQARNSNWLLKGLAIPIAVVSSAAWLLMTTKDFPFLGDTGLALFLFLGISLPIALSYLTSKLQAGRVLIVKRTYWLLVAIVGVIILFRVAWEGSIESFFINAFLGEGLWGAFFYFLFVLVGLATWLFISSKSQPNILASVLVTTFLLFLLAKTFDNFEVAGERVGIARIGFGDSLNRSLITWLPFVYLLVAELQSRLEKAK